MKFLCLTLCLLAPPCFASIGVAAPLLAPQRDVTIDYAVQPRDHQPLDMRVSVQAGGRVLRITSEDLPTAFLVDRPAHRATILLPVLKLYATIGIGPLDPQEGVLKHARFERHGMERLAGLVCTDWTAVSPSGRAEGCITSDGVILRGSYADQHGKLGSVRAQHVLFGPLPPEVFERPAGYRDAGTLPVDGLPR
jgi:hypothetical protein